MGWMYSDVVVEKARMSARDIQSATMEKPNATAADTYDRLMRKRYEQNLRGEW